MNGGAYYNEHDPKAAAWLRELIRGGHIAAGEVDERSIANVEPDDLRGFRQCHFFAGIGGWSFALRLAGVPDRARVWTGSCPCQPFSDAGKQLGADDERHLWPEFFRLIRACGPIVVFGEQVASAAVLGSAAKPSKRGPLESVGPVWLDGIFADLESAHYACGAADIPAAGLGAPHIRQRAWWAAIANGGHPGAEWLQRGGEHGLRDGGTDDRLADSEHGDGRGEQQPGEPGEVRGPGLTGSCEPRRLGDTASGGCGEQRNASQPGHSGHTERTGGAGLGVERVADGEREGLEGHAGDGDHGDEPRWIGAQPSGPATASSCSRGSWSSDHGLANPASLHGPEQLDQPGEGPRRRAIEDDTAERGGPNPWARFDLIPCRDGKARRVPQSCVLPLADGVSADLAHLRIARHCHPLTAEKVQGRAALLRGPGNAIVAQVAAVFIRAGIEALNP